MFSIDICIDILNSLPTTKYLLFCRYISSFFYDITNRYLIKKVCTRKLNSTQEFLVAKKWMPKKFKVYIKFTDKRISSISFLENVNIEFLDIAFTKVFDISPLKNTPIKKLWISSTPITDLSPLENTPIKELWAGNTSIKDLSPLAKTNIQILGINNTLVSDLFPLKNNASIKELWAENTLITKLSSLTNNKCIETLDIENTAISDVSPLINTNIKELFIQDTLVSANSSFLKILEERGVEIYRTN